MSKIKPESSKIKNAYRIRQQPYTSDILSFNRDISPYTETTRCYGQDLTQPNRNDAARGWRLDLIPTETNELQIARLIGTFRKAMTNYSSLVNMTSRLSDESRQTYDSIETLQADYFSDNIVFRTEAQGTIKHVDASTVVIRLEVGDEEYVDQTYSANRFTGPRSIEPGQAIKATAFFAIVPDQHSSHQSIVTDQQQPAHRTPLDGSQRLH